MNLSVHHGFMCNTAWSSSKSGIREESKLNKQFIILICLLIGTCTAGVNASAAPVASVLHSTILKGMAKQAASEADALLPDMDAGGGFRLWSGAGGRDDRGFRQRGGFEDIAPVIRVAGASSAKRAAEQAAGGRAVSVVKKGGRFVVTVISGGTARRCIVDAQSGQVLECR